MSPLIKLFAGAALLATTSVASAVTVYTFDDPSYQSVFTFGQFSGVVQGSVTNKYAAPQINGAMDTTRYLAVLGGSTATYTPVSGVVTSIGYDWGSIDRYNFVKAYSGNTLVSTIYGSAFPPATGDIGSAATNKFVTLNYASTDNVTRIVFGSDTNSFELDNVTVGAVPEPATWAMLITGFGLVGFAQRRRRATVAA